MFCAIALCAFGSLATHFIPCTIQAKTKCRKHIVERTIFCVSLTAAKKRRSTCLLQFHDMNGKLYQVASRVAATKQPLLRVSAANKDPLTRFQSWRFDGHQNANRRRRFLGGSGGGLKAERSISGGLFNRDVRLDYATSAIQARAGRAGTPMVVSLHDPKQRRRITSTTPLAGFAGLVSHDAIHVQLSCEGMNAATLKPFTDWEVEVWREFCLFVGSGIPPVKRNGDGWLLDRKSVTDRKAPPRRTAYVPVMHITEKMAGCCSTHEAQTAWTLRESSFLASEPARARPLIFSCVPSLHGFAFVLYSEGARGTLFAEIAALWGVPPIAQTHVFRGDRSHLDGGVSVRFCWVPWLIHPGRILSLNELRFPGYRIRVSSVRPMEWAAFVREYFGSEVKQPSIAACRHGNWYAAQIVRRVCSANIAENFDLVQRLVMGMKSVEEFGNLNFRHLGDGAGAIGFVAACCNADYDEAVRQLLNRSSRLNAETAAFLRSPCKASAATAARVSHGNARSLFHGYVARANRSTRGEEGLPVANDNYANYPLRFALTGFTKSDVAHQLRAAENAVWNAMLNLRIKRYGCRVVVGDLVCSTTEGRHAKVVLVTSPSMASQFKLSSVVLPFLQFFSSKSILSNWTFPDLEDLRLKDYRAYLDSLGIASLLQTNDDDSQTPNSNQIENRQAPVGSRQIVLPRPAMDIFNMGGNDRCGGYRYVVNPVCGRDGIKRSFSWICVVDDASTSDTVSRDAHRTFVTPRQILEDASATEKMTGSWTTWLSCLDARDRAAVGQLVDDKHRPPWLLSRLIYRTKPVADQSSMVRYSSEASNGGFVTENTAGALDTTLQPSTQEGQLKQNITLLLETCSVHVAREPLKSPDDTPGDFVEGDKDVLPIDLLEDLCSIHQSRHISNDVSQSASTRDILRLKHDLMAISALRETDPFDEEYCDICWRRDHTNRKHCPKYNEKRALRQLAAPAHRVTLNP